MKRRSQISWNFWAFMGCAALGATGCGASPEVGDAIADGETGVATAALGGPCRINTNGSAVCDATAKPVVLGRNVYYRVGANAGPGYDTSTGRHAAVVLFQGTSFTFCGAGDNGGGGNNGPGTTTTTTYARNARFGAWHQVATVIALVNAGYTVIQPAARKQSVCTLLGNPYAWDTNFGSWAGSPDQALVKAIVAALQPGSATFGAVDIHHVYAAGISSGGYMTSRMANEFAAGINGDSTVQSSDRPFRAVAIQSGSFQDCAGDNCTIPETLPNPNHPPTFFLHDPADDVVPVETMQAYFDRLDDQFDGGNPVYTVNGVQESFLKQDIFNGTLGHHQWDQNLSADSTNLILQWFASHR